MLIIPSLDVTVKKCNRDGNYSLVYSSDGAEDPAVPLTHIIQLLAPIPPAHPSNLLASKGVQQVIDMSTEQAH